MLNATFCKARTESILIQRVEDDVLVYDKEAHLAHSLNRSSAVIWEACDGTRGVADIQEVFEIKTGYAVSVEFIELGLQKLAEKQLIDFYEGIESGMSRRSLIKRVAISATIAMPLVYSIVAPEAVSAQSGPLPPGSPCQSGPQCASGNCVGPPPKTCV